MKEKTNIYLTGFMGTGKTTAAKELHTQYAYDMVDSDSLIVEKQNMAITEIFKVYGEAYFREKETEVLKEIGRKKNQAVSCGGGAVLRSQNVSLMRENGMIFWLLAEPQTVLERVKNSKERPVLNGHMNLAYIENLMKQREKAYLLAADARIYTDGKSPGEIAGEIIKIINRA